MGSKGGDPHHEARHKNHAVVGAQLHGAQPSQAMGDVGCAVTPRPMAAGSPEACNGSGAADIEGHANDDATNLAGSVLNRKTAR